MADDTDDLDKSFHEMNLEDEDASDDTRSVHTPKARKSLFVHDLTPDSKRQGLPEAKTRKTLGGELQLNEVLRYTCMEQEGGAVEQQELMDVLEHSIEVGSKSKLSRAISAVFPSSLKKRVLKDGDQITIYTNIELKSHLDVEMASGSSVPDSIKQNIRELEEQMQNIWEDIRKAIEEEDRRQAETLMRRYRLMNNARENHVKALVNRYEQELGRLQPKDELSPHQKRALLEEIEKVKDKCNLGFRTGQLKEGEHAVPATVFSTLANVIESECPVMNSILETLIGSREKDTNKMKTHDFKLRCAGHALSGLMTLANQRYANDIQLLFGLLCISYGGGKQFINMLSAIGLSLHWDSLMKHLDEKLDNCQPIIDAKFPKSIPVILLLDNINMYRGNKRHYRLFKSLSPKMWNFTGRGAIYPNLEGIEHLLQCSSTAIDPQIDFEDLKVDDILLDTMDEHKQLWLQFSDSYKLKLLDLSLNHVPPSSVQISEMNESQFNTWLSKQDFTELEKAPKKFKLTQPPLSAAFPMRQKVKPTEIVILPLSLEDNSTLPGTASIMEEFGKEFAIPCLHQVELLDFDEKSHSFDIKGARNHFEFLKIMHLHREEMAEFEERIRTDVPKQLDGSDLAQSSNDDGDDDMELADGEEAIPAQQNEGCESGSSAARIKVKHFQKQDGQFKKSCDRLTNLVWDAVQSESSETAMDLLVDKLSNDRWWETSRDHFDRTVLHHAVGSSNMTMTRVLLAAGVNPNVKEGCGIQPLHLAVIAKSTEMCRLLIENYALIDGPGFASLPSPLEMAKAMDLKDIITLFEERLTDRMATDYLVSELAKQDQHAGPNVEENVTVGENDPDAFVYERSQYCGFPTALVGDQGTCKNNRSVKQKDQSAFGWVAEIPGDLHTKGYLCEAVFKAQGKGGFHHLITNVLNRKKLTAEAFGDRKFQQQNLQHIKEAVRDGSIGYGMAAVQAFKASKFFPNPESLAKCLTKKGNHNEVLLESFKQFISESSTSDSNFSYHAEMFTLFGPLLQLYNDATSYGNGLARETVWVMLLPIFAQLRFRNYWTESLVHVVNFTSAWPLAFREMMRINSSVNLSGKDGTDMDLDEYVETNIVRPLKQYASGHSSVKTCQRIMANVQFIGNVRRLYASKDAFDVHPQVKHTEQSSFPDQVKGMWFSLREGMFKVVDGRKEPVQSPCDQDVAKVVPKALVSVYEKGETKVKENFSRKLHECFPSIRKLTFNRVVQARADEPHDVAQE